MTPNNKNGYLKMLKKTALFTLCLGLFLMFTGCGESSIAIIDPFKTTHTGPMDETTQTLYKGRIIDKESSSRIITSIKTAQEKAKQEDAGFEFQTIQYNEETKTVDISELQLDQMPIEDFDNKKEVRVKWFDSKHQAPYFMAATVIDEFIPKSTFLASQDGKEYQEFFKKLGVDEKKLINTADVAYDYNETSGVIQVAFKDDFHQLLNLRLVIKLDGFSKATMDAIAGNDNYEPDPSLLFGMLSGIRVQEIFIKMKMERNVEEVFQALPEENGKIAREEYQASKTISEQEIKQLAGKAFTLEQLQSYRQSWFNFLEQKQPLVISIHPDTPQPLPTFFTTAMMAENNPKVLANLFKQLNLKISNQDI